MARAGGVGPGRGQYGLSVKQCGLGNVSVIVLEIAQSKRGLCRYVGRSGTERALELFDCGCLLSAP